MVSRIKILRTLHLQVQANYYRVKIKPKSSYAHIIKQLKPLQTRQQIKTKLSTIIK